MGFVGNFGEGVDAAGRVLKKLAQGKITGAIEEGGKIVEKVGNRSRPQKTITNEREE